VLSLKGKDAPTIDGFTGDQRFYFGWGQSWMEKERDDSLRQQILTNPHSPSMYRANGPVRNIPEFYAAFGVKEGDKLYLPPDKRVKIW
jgi:predicted metalloendopeptidase